MSVFALLSNQATLKTLHKNFKNAVLQPSLPDLIMNVQPADHKRLFLLWSLFLFCELQTWNLYQLTDDERDNYLILRAHTGNRVCHY